MSSSLRIETRFRGKKVLRAFERAPEVMARNLQRGLSRGAEEVAREASRVAPKAFSTLTQSIKADRDTPFRYSVGPHVDYARAVEEGTGPGGNPPIQTLLDWIQVQRIEPDDPSMDARDLAYVIQDSIRRKGTPAQPYMAPTRDKMQSRVMQLIRDSAQAGLREAGLS